MLGKIKKILYPLVLILFSSFSFYGHLSNGWYLQTVPTSGSQIINDVTFLDSLKGFLITSRNINPDTASILKTTNGGDSWEVIFQMTPRRFNKLHFINDTVGYVCGYSGFPLLLKTTNAGNNWFEVATPGLLEWTDMSILSTDTIYLVDDNGFNGGIFRTTDGGQNWLRILGPSGSLPDKIYMVNGELGFITDGNYLRRTTDGGFTWQNIPSVGGFTDMVFYDSLIGWKAGSDYEIYMTTNGGINWTQQYLFRNGIVLSGIIDISMINKDTLWGVGGLIYTNPGYRPIIHKTTNGGLNWGYQLLDTGITVPFRYIQFINAKNGWSYSLNSGVHTKTGGNDTTIYTNIKQISNEIPDDYQLLQNYPNPFNPVTIIEFQIRKTSFVRLSVYDITGKHISDLVNKNLTRGEYSSEFNATNLPSGIYFYTLIINGKTIDTKKMILLK
ncbi:MAG TPA: YCF48-related protein [Ignavibacteria bacterium]|nr:YCF48-related protein [Ignavibacteria bacterium]